MCKKLTSMYVKNEYTIFQPINVSTFTGRKREWRYFRPSPSPSRVKSAYRNFLLGVASLFDNGTTGYYCTTLLLRKKRGGERRGDGVTSYAIFKAPPPLPPPIIVRPRVCDIGARPPWPYTKIVGACYTCVYALPVLYK